MYIRHRPASSPRVSTRVFSLRADEAALRAAFKKLDLNGNGVIEAFELKQVIQIRESSKVVLLLSLNTDMCANCR